MKKAGLRLNAGGHIIFGMFLNPDGYFEEHPEWYGLYQGKRATFKGTSGVNLCTSNPQAWPRCTGT